MICAPSRGLIHPGEGVGQFRGVGGTGGLNQAQRDRGRLATRFMPRVYERTPAGQAAARFQRPRQNVIVRRRVSRSRSAVANAP